MLTRKQLELLMFVHERLQQAGVPPSFDEMKEALNLRSKSGIHRLITALEERGFIRRLPNRARALEVIKLPDHFQAKVSGPPGGFTPKLVSRTGNAAPKTPSVPRSVEQRGAEQASIPVPVMGRIAAGVPISAIQAHSHMVHAPADLLGGGEHFALEVKGDSMIEAGILDGDTVLIKRTETADSGDIIVALVDEEEATLKRLRRKGGAIALEAANPLYETRIFRPDRVRIQGKLVGLMRRY